MGNVVGALRGDAARVTNNRALYKIRVVSIGRRRAAPQSGRGIVRAEASAGRGRVGDAECSSGLPLPTTECHSRRKTQLANFGRCCRHVRRSVLAQLTQDTPSLVISAICVRDSGRFVLCQLAPCGYRSSDGHPRCATTSESVIGFVSRGVLRRLIETRRATSSI